MIEAYLSQNQSLNYYYCNIDAPLLYFDTIVSSNCIEEIISVINRILILLILMMDQALPTMGHYQQGLV